MEYQVFDLTSIIEARRKGNKGLIAMDHITVPSHDRIHVWDYTNWSNLNAKADGSELHILKDPTGWLVERIGATLMKDLEVALVVCSPRTPSTSGANFWVEYVETSTVVNISFNPDAGPSTPGEPTRLNRIQDLLGRVSDGVRGRKKDLPEMLTVEAPNGDYHTHFECIYPFPVEFFEAQMFYSKELEVAIKGSKKQFSHLHYMLAKDATGKQIANPVSSPVKWSGAVRPIMISYEKCKGTKVPGGCVDETGKLTTGKTYCK